MSLRDWFGKGKHGGAGGGGWDRYNSKGERIGKCGDSKPGEGKPKCLSKAKAASLRASGGKKAIAAAVSKKRRIDSDPDRRGKAKMVSNKTKRSVKESNDYEKVEAWGYLYDKFDKKIIWSKKFPSEDDAQKWADNRNATILGIKFIKNGDTNMNVPTIKKRVSMLSDGKKQIKYQIVDSSGRGLKIFENFVDARDYYNQNFAEELDTTTLNPTDKVTMDVPLLLRVLEYAKEDAKTDMDLHDVTENLIDLSKTGRTLSMSDYNKIVNTNKQDSSSHSTTSDSQINEVGDRYWCKTEKRWKNKE